MPPACAHAAIIADPANFMALGALCDGEYSFDYDAIRKHRGLAWYPIVTQNGGIATRKPALKYGPGIMQNLGFVQGSSLYEQGVRDLDRFAWVSNPALCGEV